MFGRRKKGKYSEESTRQSAMILESLEMADDDQFADELSREEEEILAGLDSEGDDELIEEEPKPKKRWSLFGWSKKKDINLYEEEEDEEEDEDPEEEDEEVTDDQDLTLNPALFDLADEMDQYEEESGPEGYGEDDISPESGVSGEIEEEEDIETMIGDRSIDALIGRAAGGTIFGLSAFSDTVSADTPNMDKFAEYEEYPEEDPGQEEEEEYTEDDSEEEEEYTEDDSVEEEEYTEDDSVEEEYTEDDSVEEEEYTEDDSVEEEEYTEDDSVEEEYTEDDSVEEEEFIEEDSEEEETYTEDEGGEYGEDEEDEGGEYGEDEEDEDGEYEEDEEDEDGEYEEDEDGEYEEDEEDDGDEDDIFDDDEVEYYDDGSESNKKRILIGAAVGLLVLGLAAFFIIKNLRKAPEGKVYVETVAAIMGYDLGSTRSNRYSGIVEAQKQTKVTLEEGMTVSKCYVSVGDDVKKGDKLFKYDTEALNLQAQKKQLEIDQTNQKITSAQKKKDEYDKDARTAQGVDLLDAQQGSAEEELNIETYKLDLAAKKKELSSINKNIKNSVVKSKTNGKVLKINTALGKGVEAEAESDTSQENSDNTYILIVAQGDYQVKARINETNMQKGAPKAGDRVTIYSRITDDTWTGVVKSLRSDQTSTDEENTNSSEEDEFIDDTAAETDTKYPCTITLDSSEGLMLGQHVLVSVGENDQATDSDKDKSFYLDETYILEEDGNYYVFADNGKGRIEKRKIKIGEYNEDEGCYLIKGGLELTDLIADTMNVSAGMATTTNESEAIDQYGDEEDEEEYFEEDDTGDMEEFDDGDLDGLEIDE